MKNSKRNMESVNFNFVSMHTETRCKYDAFLESKLCCDHRNEEHGGPFYVVWEDGGGRAVGREGYFISYISRLFWRAAKTQKRGRGEGRGIGEQELERW